MSVNELVQIRTVPITDEDGRETFAITIALNLGDRATLNEFVAEVVQTFLAHRMRSPPTTDLLLVTIMGEVSAHEFAECWRMAVARDAALMYWMGRSRRADVLQGTADGVVISRTSLLEEG